MQDSSVFWFPGGMFIAGIALVTFGLFAGAFLPAEDRKDRRCLEVMALGIIVIFISAVAMLLAVLKYISQS
jgi:hypothetical protein